MANQIQATVYQIDGSPLNNSIQIAFLTSNVYMREFQTDLIPAVNSAIVYYPNTNNQLQEQTFLVSETITALVSSANSGGTTQISTTVLEINQEPQIPSGVTFSFPVQGISIWPVANPVVGGVNSYLEFKNKKYYLLEDEGALVTAANVNNNSGSTGVNGLNGTTSIGLGGTLTGDTIINGLGTYNLFFGDDNLIDRIDVLKFRSIILDIENFNSGSTSKIYADSNYLYLQFTENLNGYVSTIFLSATEIRTTTANGNFGLKIDVINNISVLGDYTDDFNDTKLVVDDANNTMQTFGLQGQGGLDFNFSTEQYILGANNSKVTCDNVNQELTLSCSSIILSNTPSILSATITTTATPLIPSDYLTIFINGQQRKIQLFNP